MLLVKENKIDWEKNDVKYLRKVRDKYWPGRRTPTYRTNWKVSTTEFRTESLLEGARHKLNKANEAAATTDIGDSTDSEESNKAEDDIEASEGGVEEDMPKPRSARKKTPSKTDVSTPVKYAADDDDLVESIGKILIKDKFKSYNFNTTDPTFF